MKKYKVVLQTVYRVQMYYPYNIEEYVEVVSKYDKMLSSEFTDEIKAKIYSMRLQLKYYKKSFNSPTPKRVLYYKTTKELERLIDKYPEKLI